MAITVLVPLLDLSSMDLNRDFYEVLDMCEVNCVYDTIRRWVLYNNNYLEIL